MKNRLIKTAAVVCLCAASMFGQHPDGLPNGGGPQLGGPGRGMHVGPPGRWWSDPSMVQKLGLTADQQKKMDGVVQQSRFKLIDLVASLQKQEAIMEPLIEADQPDEPKILAQIDRVAQARAELEKANARMLLGIRSALTPDQWKKLQADAPRLPHDMGGAWRGGPGSPAGGHDGLGGQNSTGGPPREN